MPQNSVDEIKGDEGKVSSALIDSGAQRFLEDWSELGPRARMRAGVTAKCPGCGLVVELVRSRSGRRAMGDPHTNTRVSFDVAEPLRAAPETGDHDVPTWGWVVDHFKDDVAAMSRLSPDVFEHEQS